MTKKEIVITLREQDRLLQEIFQTRKELVEMTKQENIYMMKYGKCCIQMNNLIMNFNNQRAKA